MTRIERLKLLASAIAGDFKSLRFKLGNTDELVTDDKTSAVNAINEVAGFSKEIKDAIEKFKAEIGIDPEIAKINDIPVNPFELLVPFIKEQLFNGQTENAEYNERVFYIPKNTHVLLHIFNGELKTKTAFKIKQKTFEKFIKFNSPINNDFAIPDEIDINKEYTISKYDIFGHYQYTYKIIPQEQFMQNKIDEIFANLNNIVDINQIEYINSKQIIIANENDIELINTLLNKRIDISTTTEDLISIFNQDLTKYYNIRKSSWENMTDISNTISMTNILNQYINVNNTDSKVLISGDYIKNNVYTNSNSTKDILFIEKADFMTKEEAIELNKASNKLLTNALYLTPNGKEFFNPFTKEWENLPDWADGQIKPLVYSKYKQTLETKANSNEINFYNGETNLLTQYSYTTNLAPSIGFVDTENNFVCNINQISAGTPIILNTSASKFYDYILTKTWVDTWDDMRDGLRALTSSKYYIEGIIPLSNKINKINEVMDSIDITKIYNISAVPANEQAYTQLNNSLADKDIVQVVADVLNKLDNTKLSNLQNAKIIDIYDDHIANKNDLNKISNAKIIINSYQLFNSDERIELYAKQNPIYLSLNTDYSGTKMSEKQYVRQPLTENNGRMYWTQKKLSNTKFVPLLNKLEYTDPNKIHL